MSSAQVNGITIEFEVFGEGQPLLLVMGLGTQLLGWPKDFVDGLVERGFQVIRYDNRDVGLSSKLSDGRLPGRATMLAALLSRRVAGKHAPYLLADMADDAAALLDHLDIDRAHIVGASMGAMIGQTLAIDHPAKVASLCSIMSNTGDRRHGRVHASVLRHWKTLFPKSLDDAVENALKIARLVSGPTFDEAENRAVIEQSLERSYDADGATRQSLAIAASPDRTRGLRRLTVPTLVIHGMLDKLVLPSGGAATARAVPGAQLLMFPEMAHDLPRVRWEEIFEAITANARRADPPPQRAGARA